MQSNRRILLLSVAIPPDPLTGAARAGRFRHHLPSFGFDVEVIAEGPFSSSTSGVRRVTRILGARLAPVLSRLAAFLRRFAAFLRRLLANDDQLPWSAHVYAAAVEMASAQPFHAVLSTAPPMGVHLAALARRFRIPAICDSRDPLVGNPFRKPQGLVHYDNWLESFIARQASAIVLNTDSALDAFLTRHPQSASKCHLLWNGFDGPLPLPSSDCSSSGPVSVIAHVGTLFGGRDPGALLSSLTRLAAASALPAGSLHFRLCGPIFPEMERRLSAAAQPLASNGLLEIDNRDIPRQEAGAISASADATLIVDTDDSQASLKVPAKLFPAVLLGRPILALTYSGSPAQSALQRSGVPFACIDPRSEPSVIDAQLAAFLRLPRTTVAPAPWFLETFDGKRQTAQLARILDASIHAAAHPTYDRSVS